MHEKSTKEIQNAEKQHKAKQEENEHTKKLWLVQTDFRKEIDQCLSNASVVVVYNLCSFLNVNKRVAAQDNHKT